MFQNMGLWDWLIVLVLFLLLFGGKRLPEMAHSLGKSFASLKKGLKDGEKELKKSLGENS